MSNMGEAMSWFMESPWGILLGVVGAMLVMYMGRGPVHGMIRALSCALKDVFMMASAAVMSARERAVERNRQVLLEMGRERTGRLLEREFDRVNTVVVRDLSGYPTLHRQLSDQITQIDEDYAAAADVPPDPPEWVEAVQTISSIQSNNDPLIRRILTDLQKRLDASVKKAMGEYRASSRERHRLLGKMLPFWRRLNQTLDRVGGTIRGLDERSKIIDEQMKHYEDILSNSDRAVQTLSASSMTHFITSGFVLLIALLGGFINFHLIALPMSEMVGATSYVGSVKTSDIAGLVIILTEVAMGLFLMESLRITRMFPVIGMMDDVMRKRMVWISFSILLTLACVESSLAYMRDLLAADREALTQSLAGIQMVDTQLRWIPSVGQMVMGFMLPFALTFAAIPLESFIQSARNVMGSLLCLLLGGLASLLAVLGTLAGNLLPTLAHVYDLAIVVPLRLEQMVTQPKAGKVGASDPSSGRPHETV